MICMRWQDFFHLLHPVIAPALHELAELFEGDPIPKNRLMKIWMWVGMRTRVRTKKKMRTKVKTRIRRSTRIRMRKRTRMRTRVRTMMRTRRNDM